MSLETRLIELHRGRFGGDGLVVEATMEGSVTGGCATLAGAVVHPDRPDGPQGDIKRQYVPVATAPAEVINAGLGLPAEYQNRGFYSDLSGKVEAGYRREGILHIRIVAGRDAGGLVWASTFDFDDTRVAGFGEPSAVGAGVGAGGEHVRITADGDADALRVELVTAIADAALATGRITPSERDGLGEVLGDLLVPSWILNLPDTVGRRMLRGSRWPGVKTLVPHGAAG